MVNILLFDTPVSRTALAPFTDTKPIAALRVGIRTIIEKWADSWPGCESISYLTTNHLQAKFPAILAEQNLCIHASFLPTEELIQAMGNLAIDTALWHEDQLVAFWMKKDAQIMHLASLSQPASNLIRTHFTGKLTQIKNKWDLFLQNATAIKEDLQHIRTQRKSQPIDDPHTICYNAQDIFIEAGAQIKAAILNAEAGPIYIGKDAVVEEQAVLKGPVALCEGAQVKVGSTLSHGTTIGPYSKVGGEISNTVIFEYSNKAHSGFIGNSVIGEWCNLGANTTTSNLRNDYRTIKVWDQEQEDFTETGLQFCGLFLGAYSKCGINTMFNTGSVIGICTNLFGAGYMKRFIPSFTKGSPPDGFYAADLDHAIESIKNTMARRNQGLSITDIDMLVYLYEQCRS
jgi:UDP-N-acetylglucosamine diphosphorylase/glucosamine-1-phosphate N-acetyltransferase